ncbi:MAG: glycoside hydrolase family 3 protein [Lachnospiraceae bacterium]|nr:glycoside hydrolase family 3 protein [Lachnospiraceae bacterium]
MPEKSSETETVPQASEKDDVRLEERGTGKETPEEVTKGSIQENGPDSNDMEKRIDEMLREMPLRERITLLLMPALKTWKEGGIRADCGGLSEEQLQLLREYHFGGIILFGENCLSAQQTRAFTDTAQQANREGGAVSGLLMATDQEGGYVTRLAKGTSMPGNMALAATGDPENARIAAAVIGEELHALGIHLDLAPSLDVNSNPQNPVIGVRSFSDDPDVASEFGKAFIDGLHESGIGAVVKHFPGHGDTAADSHSGLPVVTKTLQELRDFELRPFAATVEDADAVMTAHISFPNIETETAVSRSDGQKITLPATMSYTLITEVLRGELGFSGVVITDALYMGAVSAHFTPLDAGKRAILAGADLLLMPVELTDSQVISELSAYVSGLLQMVESGEIPAERIEESARRILRLKAKYGLLYGMDSERAEDTADLSCVGSYEHHEIEWKIARKAVTVVKDDGKLLPVQDVKKVMVACPYESQLLSVEYAKRRLLQDGMIGEDTEISAFCFETLPSDAAAQKIADADLVIGISAMYHWAELDPGTEAGKRSAFLDALIAEAHSRAVPFVLISAQLPYDVSRYDAADAILCCYLAHGMSALPPEGVDWYDVPEYGANLPAAIYRIFGE